MAGNVKGITIEFRGETTELQKALKKVRAETKGTQDELKQINRSLHFNPTSVQLWEQKQKALKQAIAETETNLKDLKAAQAKLDAAGVDRNSAEYRELEREIIKAENQQKRLNAELRQIPTPKIKAASEAMKQFGDKAKKAGSYMTTHFTAPIAAGYTAAAKYASDYEENMNKLDVAFGENSEAVKEWANTARVSFGLSKVQASESAAAFGALGKGIGLSEEEAAGMSTTLAGLSADLGSYFNVGTDESSKALEGIFTGESEALKKFGVVMTDTNLKQFAEDQGLVWSEMDQTQKTMLRYQYVMEKTKDAQGDFSRTSDGTANSIKIFQASVQDLATAIGTNLLPIVTPVIQKITEILNKFNEMSPQAQKIVTIIGLVVAAIGPLLIIVGSLASGIGALMTVGPALIAGLGTVVTAIGPVILIIGALVAAGVMLYKNWDTIKAWAIETWETIKSTVVSKVEALRTGLIAKWEAIKATVVQKWNEIKNAIVQPIEQAQAKVKAIIDKIKSIFPISVGKIFTNLKVPTINVSGGKAPFGIGGMGKKPSISVSWHAQGGIFDRPTLLTDSRGGVHGLGEHGAEAIMPLDPLWDKLDRIAEATATAGDITVNVYAGSGDAREIAEEVKRVIIQEVKQRRLAWQ